MKKIDWSYLLEQPFTRLTVVEIVNIDKGYGKRPFARCLCECGKEVLTRPQYLINGHSKSCGCWKRGRRQHEVYNWSGHQEISGKVWYGIRASANQRKIEFELTIQESWELFLEQGRRCALTGLILEFPSSFAEFKVGTASLDRIDSSLPYRLNNVQWVHKKVNMMKQSMSQTEFIEFCKLVAKHHDYIQSVA